MEHKLVSVVLKKAMVDEGMVPIIKWLNGFDGIMTLACCEGHHEKDPGNPCGRPYILWYALNPDPDDLETVITRLPKTEINRDHIREIYTYYTYWNDREHFNRWAEQVRDINERLGRRKKNKHKLVM